MKLSTPLSVSSFGLIFLFMLASLQVSAQLTVTPNLTPQQLANNLIGGGITISNVTMTCPTDASGTFTSPNTNLGLPAGTILTSGTAVDATGTGNGTFASTSHNAAGDPQLAAATGQTINDACALEFDLIASCDTIQIAYVFASEEYPFYVNSQFNDVFGFFISGPNPQGGTYTNNNIAVVPNTALPVTIGNINQGQYSCPGPSTGCTNCQYYTDNCAGTTINYDGFTTPLIALAEVYPCSTYHLKLAIGDAVDWSFDSAVFLEQGGIKCFGGLLSLNFFSLNGSNTLVEGCTNGAFVLERSGDISQPLTVNFSVGGTATPGTDYNALPSSITFPANVDSVALPLIPISDAMAEGSETVLLIVSDTVCNTIFGDTATFFIIDPPVANFSANTVCEGSPTPFIDLSTFGGGPLTSWNWDFGDGNTSTAQNPLYTYAAAGTYNVSLTVATNDGCTDSYSASVTVNPNPVSSFTYSGVCLGQPTQFNDLSSAPGGATITNWAWDFGDLNTSTQQNPNYIYSASGIFTVTLTVTTSDGCVGISTQNITINPSPAPDFDADPVCFEEVTTLINTSSVSPGGFVASSFWDFDDGNTSTVESPTHLYTAPGNYNVTLTITTGDGCIDSITKVVIVNPLPDVNFTNNVTCFFDTTFFTDQSGILTGSNVAWAWDFGDGSSSTLQNPSHVYQQPGLYSVTLIVTSDEGCVSELTRDAEVTPPPYTPIVENDTVCNGFSPTLAVDAPNNVTIFWYYTSDGGTPFHVGDKFQMQPIDRDFTFWVEAVDNQGCRSPLVPIHAEAYGPPSGGMTASAYETEIPNAIIEFWLQDPIRPIQTFNWDFGDGSTSQSPSPVHEYTAPGEYEVTLSIIDFRGCESVMRLTVEVDERIRLYVPTAFSPNGDGINDLFFIKSRLLTSVHLSVFDRWGKLVYDTYNLNFEWDGTGPGNSVLPEGVYMYIIDANAYNGLPVTKKGSVTLIR